MHFFKKLSFVDLALLCFHVLLDSGLSLLQHAVGFFDECVLLHLLLLSFGDSGSVVFLFVQKILDVFGLDLQLIAELRSLNNCRFKTMVGLLHVLLTLDDHSLPLAAVGKSKAFPEAELGDPLDLIVADSRVYGP